MFADMGKYRLTVIFGQEACDYADGHGAKKTAKALDAGKFECGMHRTYELDTWEDVLVLTQALDDAWGWDASYFDIEQHEDGKWYPKPDPV